MTALSNWSLNTSFIPKLAGILEAAKTGWLPQCCPLHSTCIFFVPVYSRGLPHHSCSHAQRTAGACTLQVARPLRSPNISSPDHCSGAAAIPTPLDEHPHPLARLTSLRGQRGRLRQVNCPHLLGGAAPAVLWSTARPLRGRAQSRPARPRGAAARVCPVPPPGLGAWFLWRSRRLQLRPARVRGLGPGGGAAPAAAAPPRHAAAVGSPRPLPALGLRGLRAHGQPAERGQLQGAHHGGGLRLHLGDRLRARGGGAAAAGGGVLRCGRRGRAARAARRRLPAPGAAGPASAGGRGAGRGGRRQPRAGTGSAGHSPSLPCPALPRPARRPGGRAGPGEPSRAEPRSGQPRSAALRHWRARAAAGGTCRARSAWVSTALRLH